MKRPNKKDYNFNDIFDSILFARYMIDYADYLEHEIINKNQEDFVNILKVPEYLKSLIDFVNINLKHTKITEQDICDTLYFEKQKENLKNLQYEARKSN